jgi:hypothetical protein
MRWIPTKFALWPSGTAFTPYSRLVNPAGVRLPSLAASLAWASLANAGELVRVPPLESSTGHWPWIAGAAILGLLGVVSFASRRRIHSILGS